MCLSNRIHTYLALTIFPKVIRMYRNHNFSSSVHRLIAVQSTTFRRKQKHHFFFVLLTLLSHFVSFICLYLEYYTSIVCSFFFLWEQRTFWFDLRYYIFFLTTRPIVPFFEQFFFWINKIYKFFSETKQNKNNFVIKNCIHTKQKNGKTPCMPFDWHIFDKLFVGDGKHSIHWSSWTNGKWFLMLKLRVSWRWKEVNFIVIDLSFGWRRN